MAFFGLAVGYTGKARFGVNNMLHCTGKARFGVSSRLYCTGKAQFDVSSRLHWEGSIKHSQHEGSIRR